MTIAIGIDPHKASRIAAAIDNTECVLDEIRVRASTKQTDQLRTWADGFPDRVWVIESAHGLGYLLAHQLVATGETVVDVPAVLSTRTRLLGSGKAQKNDPNDARSVAIAALRTGGLARVRCDDHAQVLKLLAKRHRDMGRLHGVAITQLRYPCEGRVCYDRKRAEGKSAKEAIRALKRQISNVVHRALLADARRLDN